MFLVIIHLERLHVLDNNLTFYHYEYHKIPNFYTHHHIHKDVYFHITSQIHLLFLILDNYDL